MATRFRLTADTNAPAVSPALQSYSHNAPTKLRRRLLTSDASALSTDAYTPDAADHLVAGDALHGQFISDPMVAGVAFTNGDTIKFAVQGLEAHAGNNLNIQVFAAIVTKDGGTVQRTIRSKSADGTELATALTNRTHSTTQDGATYTTVAGDRLLVEFSVTGTPTGASGVQGHNASLRWGSAGAGGDLAENDTDTGTTGNPWIEFVPSATFQDEIELVAAGTPLAGASGQTTAAIAVPSGAASGQVAVVTLYVETDAAITPPSGFSQLGMVENNRVGGAYRDYVFTKTLTGADAGTWDFTWTGGAYREGSGYLYKNTNGNGITATLLNSAVRDDAASSNIPAVSGTPASANCRLVWVASCITGSATWTVPTSFTTRTNLGAARDTILADRIYDSTSATGSLTGSYSGVANSAGAMLIELAPATATKAIPPFAVRPLRFITRRY